MKRFFTILVCLIAGPYLFYKMVSPTYSWHQKTILEVQTPNGLVRGGSVVEVSVHWYSQLEADLSQGHSARNDCRGEASFVEVAPGKFLFALTVNEPWQRTYDTMHNADDAKSGVNSAKVLTQRLVSSHESRSIPPDKYPTLVTFDDINDPKSVRLVDPANFIATFGEGYRLKDIKLEITDDKVTDGKVTALGFFSEFSHQTTLSGLEKYDENTPDEENYLTEKTFRQGFGK